MTVAVRINLHKYNMWHIKKSLYIKTFKLITVSFRTALAISDLYVTQGLSTGNNWKREAFKNRNIWQKTHSL